jgi:hypothetical protein
MNTRTLAAPITLAGIVVQIEASADQSAAVRSDHTLWTWGANNFQQLGYPTPSSVTTPTRVNLINVFAVGLSEDGGHAIVGPQFSCWRVLSDHSAVTIPDVSTVSVGEGNGCVGVNASSSSTVTVNITHTFIGDLVIDLIAPTGNVYNLWNRAGGSADNINQSFPVNLSGEPLLGVWTLRIRDAAALDSGTLNSLRFSF